MCALCTGCFGDLANCSGDCPWRSPSSVHHHRPNIRKCDAAFVYCRGRPYWTLACPQSTCSDWDGHSFQRRSSISDSSFALPPAGFLQTDTRVHHTVTQDSPSRGAVTRHSQQQVHTSRRRQQNTGVKNQLQNNPDGSQHLTTISCD